MSTQTNISNGIKQAASEPDATVLGARYPPAGMGRSPWLTLVVDQAGACKLLGNILVYWLAWNVRDETWNSDVDPPLEDPVC